MDKITLDFTRSHHNGATHLCVKNSTTGFKIQQPDTKTNFTKVPNSIFNLKLDPYEKLILVYLHSKSSDFIHDQKFIGEHLGMSRQKVSRALISLSNLGYLTTKVDVTQSNTTKKTDIQRLNTKIENSPVLEPSPPVGVTVHPGEFKEEILTGKKENNMSPKKVDDILQLFGENELKEFNKLNSNTKEQVIKKFNLDYDDELLLLKRIKDKTISFNYDQSKVKEGVNTSTEKTTLINDSNRVVIEEPKTVQLNNPTDYYPPLGCESSAPKLGSNVYDDMFYNPSY